MLRVFKAAVCCEGAYLLFLAATLPYGPVFSVSAENLYARGAYFYIYVAMYYAAMLYLMVATVRTAAAFQNRSRMLIYPLTLFLGAETVIQLALPALHVTWLCVTLLSVLYYIYCSEMWNQLDALTRLIDEDFSTVINEYSQRCITLGKTVKLVQNNTETTAFAKAIAPDGCLICENENGEFTVNSGLVRVRGVGGEYV